MGHIRKLPFILGFSAAIVTGIVGYSAGVVDQAIYLRMALMMLLFYILGIFISSTIETIKKEVAIRKIERKNEERLRKKQMKEEEKEAIAAAASASLRQKAQEDPLPRKIDLAADDSDEDFEPLTVSRAIRTKINE